MHTLYRVPQFRWESQQRVIVLTKINQKVHIHIHVLSEVGVAIVFADVRVCIYTRNMGWRNQGMLARRHAPGVYSAMSVGVPDMRCERWTRIRRRHIISFNQ